VQNLSKKIKGNPGSIDKKILRQTMHDFNKIMNLSGCFGHTRLPNPSHNEDFFFLVAVFHVQVE
jgi:hypothetical protein